MRGLPRFVGLFILLPSFLLVTAVGCGDSFGTVSGEVKINGVPAPKGEIVFVGQERVKKAATGSIENGKYTVSGIPVGKVKIVLQNVTAAPGGDDKDKDKSKFKPKPKPKSKKKEPPPLVFPAKYANEKTTDLEFTVVKGEQVHPGLDIKNE